MNRITYPQQRDRIAVSGVYAKELHALTRAQNTKFKGLSDYIDQAASRLKDVEYTSLYLLRHSVLAHYTKVTRQGTDRPIVEYAGEDYDLLRTKERGIFVPAVAAIDADMRFVFIQNTDLRLYNTNSSDYGWENVRLPMDIGRQKLVAPLYVQNVDMPPTKLGAWSITGKDLTLAGSDLATQEERILELMLFMSSLSSGVSTLIHLNVDPLTLLLQRGEFMRELRVALARHTTDGTDVSLVLTDIDRFKSVNDTHGHLKGNIVITDVAMALSNSIRTNIRPHEAEKRTQVNTVDYLGRYTAGDEFITLVYGGLDVARACAERMKENVQSLRFKFDEALRITCSFGVASLSQILGGKPVDLDRTDKDLIHAADTALYKAKNDGRNRVCVHS